MIQIYAMLQIGGSSRGVLRIFMMRTSVVAPQWSFLAEIVLMRGHNLTGKLLLF